MIATPQPLVVVQRIDAQASLSGVLRCTMFTLVMTGLLFTLSGCHSIEASHRQLTPPLEQIGVSNEIPREQCKVVLPDYTIEPPDILNIDAIRVLPRSPYKLRALDTVSVSAAAPLPDQPIEGPKQIELDGTVQLGGIYGSVRIAGMTREEAQQAIISHLRGTLKEPSVTLTLVQTASQQQVAGQHLVGPDGRITLGSYGKVLVVGMTVEEAKAAIEQHLSRYMDEPEVAVDVFGYNSKVYYIIT
ncbi:MAG: polysaccharide biosynthesis/export family protein, partial [Planctomycetota bacterium]|nr:polysaccharide biosynthesis/export family protein [Planctomycetota bacterium]